MVTFWCRLHWNVSVWMAAEQLSGLRRPFSGHDRRFWPGFKAQRTVSDLLAFCLHPVWITLRVTMVASKQLAVSVHGAAVRSLWSRFTYVSEWTGEEKQQAKMRSSPPGSLRSTISGMSNVWNSVWSLVRCGQGNINHFSRFVCKWWREAGTEKLLVKAIIHKKDFVNVTKAQKTKAHKYDPVILNTKATTMQTFSTVFQCDCSNLVVSITHRKYWQRSQENGPIDFHSWKQWSHWQTGAAHRCQKTFVCGEQTHNVGALMGHKHWNVVIEIDTININVEKVSLPVHCPVREEPFCRPPLTFIFSLLHPLASIKMQAFFGVAAGRSAKNTSFSVTDSSKEETSISWSTVGKKSNYLPNNVNYECTYFLSKWCTDLNYNRCDRMICEWCDSVGRKWK